MSSTSPAPATPPPAAPHGLTEEEFAAERSHRDVQTAAEFRKTLCQMLFAINGLATTALVAYSGTHGPTVAIPVTAVLVSTSCFVFGVFCAALAIFAFTNMTEAWATRWQLVAQHAQYVEKHRNKAMRLRKVGRSWCGQAWLPSP